LWLFWNLLIVGFDLSKIIPNLLIFLLNKVLFITLFDLVSFILNISFDKTLIFTNYINTENEIANQILKKMFPCISVSRNDSRNVTTDEIVEMQQQMTQNQLQMTSVPAQDSVTDLREHA
jgi:hypothetical protein